MYENLDIFRTSAAMARHAGSRQALVARNIANADTPGYAASHIASFRDTVDTGGPGSLRTTRPGHLSVGPGGGRAAAADAHAEPSPGGNAVSLEQEMLEAVEVSREHNRAVSVYRHAMQVIRLSIGRS